MLKSKAAKPDTEFAEKDADDISTKVPSHHDTMSVDYGGAHESEKEKSGDDSSGKIDGYQKQLQAQQSARRKGSRPQAQSV